MRKLYDSYSPDRLSLADRAYVSGIHPLELWLAGYLYRHPGASMREIVAASADVRQESYGWLFKSSRISAQNRRIRTLLEQEAFVPIHAQWKRMGYPFDRLVPSYATAIGTSGDRPDALAELMGIVVNNGIRLPTVRIERLRFAADTPYETIVEADPPEPVRVLRPEIAAVVRRALVDTVESGTARPASHSFRAAARTAMVGRGPTGNGDHHTQRQPGGRRCGSRCCALRRTRPMRRSARPIRQSRCACFAPKSRPSSGGRWSTRSKAAPPAARATASAPPTGPLWSWAARPGPVTTAPTGTPGAAG